MTWLLWCCIYGAFRHRRRYRATIKGYISISVVDVPLVTTIAFVEDCRAFICASELPGVVAHLRPAAFLAWKVDDTGSLNVSLSNGLHFRPL